MDTTLCTTGSYPAGARTATPQPVQSQETTPANHPPSLAERMPQASLLSIPAMPASGTNVLAAAGTPPHQAATELLDLPGDLLLRLIPFLRTENTIPAIRNVARFRATCEHLHQAIPHPIPEGVMGAVEFNRPDVLKRLLLELQLSGKDVAQHLNCEWRLLSIPTSDGVSLPPLAVAAYLGHVDLISTLVGAGAKVDHIDSRGFTALMLAAGPGHTATAQALLQAGATVDQQADSRDLTALMHAAMNGHTDMVQALLAWGARFDQAIADDRSECYGWTALAFASEGGHTDAVQALLKAGAAVDQAKGYCPAALLQAAEKGNTGAVLALLQAGAKVNLAYFGWTALMCAAQNGHAAAVHALLQAGADFTLADKRGYTALDFATANKHEEVIELLRAHAAAANT